MGLARDLVDLEARIREQADLDVFAPLTRGAGILPFLNAPPSWTR
jgi:hypothetical protein